MVKDNQKDPELAGNLPVTSLTRRGLGLASMPLYADSDPYSDKGLIFHLSYY